MASLYDKKWFLDSGLWGGSSSMPTATLVQPKSLYDRNYSTPIPKIAQIPDSNDQGTETTDLSSVIATPEVQSSIASYYKNLGKQTKEASEYYKKANLANKIAAYTNIAQAAGGLINTYETGRRNVRLTNKQLDMQKDLIDLNIKNSEAVLSAQFKNAIADLQTVYAAKNVDISSQALRSEIVGSGEDMGKDMADMRTQGKLQKLAIDFQKSVNKAKQHRNEQQAWINFGASAMQSALFLI